MAHYLQDHLACLVPNGILLANLLNIVKSKGASSHRKETIHVRVKEIILNLIKMFTEAQEEASFPEQSIKKLLKKFEGTLEEFIKYDPDKKSEYQFILKAVNDSQCGKLASAGASTPAAILSRVPSQEDLGSTSCDLDYKLVYEELLESEKQCLSCFFLFPAGVEVKKRELIHCWIGMDLISSSEEGEEILDKLVDEGIVERSFSNKKLFNRYKIQKILHLKLAALVNNHPIGTQRRIGSWSGLIKKQDLGEVQQRSLTRSITLLYKNPQENQLGEEQVEALVNINQNMLNAKRFESLSKMKNLKVLHLGSWQQDPTNYVTVDEIDIFKDLKHMRQLRFLSLEGVSGIVELPHSVYELKYLKVLDLRECHNLEFLPSGIEMLKNLTHLDLSQCYLLDHVPFGITSLIHLQVLKGFLIGDNDEDGKQSIQQGRRKKGKEKANIATPCPFSGLAELKLLRKLTIRTRRANFPTEKDLQTLCEMKQLHCLRIAWAGRSNAIARGNGGLNEAAHTGGNGQRRLPATLTKLELHAAPEHTVSWLLRLVSEDTDNYRLEKLYIIGGRLRELHQNLSFVHVKEVRLRYLPMLHSYWDQFRKLFPNLGHLDILGCPYLILFPCDKNGVWVPEKQGSPSL